MSGSVVLDLVAFDLPWLKMNGWQNGRGWKKEVEAVCSLASGEIGSSILTETHV